MTIKLPTVYPSRCSTRFFILILLINGIALFSYERTAFSSPPVTLADAVKRLSDEVVRQYGANELKLEFLNGSYVGANRRFDAQFRSNTAIFRGRIDANGKLFLTERQERSEGRAVLWQSAPSLNHLPDLDQLLVKAETLVRAKGYKPTQTVLFKFLQKTDNSRVKIGLAVTRIFFEIANSKTARVVEFHGDRLHSHRSGTLLKVSLPVVILPKISLPEVEALKIKIPQLQSPALQSFRTQSNETLIRIESDFLFGFNEDKPRPQADQLLAQLVAALREENPSVIKVEGHTDSWGTPQYNHDLSKRRAQEIARRLQASGISADKITITPYGEAKPIAAEVHQDGSDDPKGRSRNRRVEVRFH